ncbi:hypothetical protein AHMF7605_02275 [Adhaeribacter arboris]|uniref:DUF4890 domain-containing protein n=1 Tax=Adhaeribacter arboris TaxID=2072846 RepID=A0A2T2YA91_9BACT|nr:DUF4890 domain-containing protein [Adhaeribacter arboris]PSR52432.1 hypothetical protein AHMF7605_02275 [Adhaeribacter arboris]
MKKFWMMTFLLWASVFGVQAQRQDKTETIKERADRLSDQMIRELRLNNFQAKRLREINQEKVSKMVEIEQKYANNPSLAEKNCQGVCRERDKELENFLSLDQYGQYYGNRSEFYKYDKDFAKSLGLSKSKKTSNPLSKSIGNNSTNTTASDPVLRPAINR